MKLSVVIPSFNDPRVVEAVQSVTRLEAPEGLIEVLVQDGGSTPEVLDQIRTGLPEYGRLVVEQDRGIFDGINRGLRNATGDMILTIGSDDRIYDLKYATIAALYEQGYDFIVGSIEYTDDQWTPVRVWPGRRLSLWSYIMGLQYPHFGLICTPAIYEMVGYFNADNPVNADYEFFYCCVQKRARIMDTSLDRPVVQMKMGGNSSRNIKAIMKANLRMMRYAIVTNPALLLGFALKPLHKLREFSRARLAR